MYKVFYFSQICLIELIFFSLKLILIELLKSHKKN